MRAEHGRLLGTGTPALPAPWPRMAMALAANELRLAARRGESLLITFVIPAGVLLLFSAFDISGATAAGKPVDRMLPGSMALAVIAAAMVSLAIATRSTTWIDSTAITATVLDATSTDVPAGDPPSRLMTP